MNNFKNVEKEIKQIVSNQFPEWYVERGIIYKKSHTVWCCGDTKIWKYSSEAIIRLSSRFNQKDNNTLVHELIHACLPFNTGHGIKFQKVCEYIEAHTSWRPRHKVKPPTPKYNIEYFEEGIPSPFYIKKLYRATKVVQYLKARNGRDEMVRENKKYIVILKEVK